MRPESELAASSQQILASRPELDTVVLPVLVQRFPQLTEAEIMVIAGIPREEIRHYRPDPGPAAGAAGIIGRRPARLPVPSRPIRLAGRQQLKQHL